MTLPIDEAARLTTGAIMRTAFALGFVLLLPAIMNTDANAQGTPECYATFPGAKGKRCCDASFKSNPRGTLQPDKRMSGLNACMAKGTK